MAVRFPSSGRQHLRAASPGVTRVSAPFVRLLSAFASRFANRKFFFAIGAVAILSAKLVHLYAYFAALSTANVLRWGFSFFAQDTACLLAIRFLLDTQIFTARWLRIILTIFASLLVLIALTLACINNAFFIVTGLEPHWRNGKLASDSSSWKLALTGLFTCTLVLAAVLGISWLMQDICYVLAGLALDILKWPFTFVLSKISARRHLPPNLSYSHVPQQDVEGGVELVSEENDKNPNSSSAVSETPCSSRFLVGMYVLVGLSLFLQVFLSIVRPDEGALAFMSWTLPLMPFVDFAHSSPTLANLLPLHGTGINHGWDGRTALADPIAFDWLPKDTPLPGFEDWYEKGKKHYRASEDPLKISNLESELLPALRDTLANATIRHVMLIKLESTRKDVFPFKKDGYTWRRLANSFENKEVSEAALERLETLTNTANFLTGDYEDGFNHTEQKRRGGINVNNAHTSSTYTLKSLTGTLCGLSPLVADFNVEYLHHIYQPCLPQIFDAFNHKLDQDKDKADFTSFKWKSSFMMSVTNAFDKQDKLMPTLGFPVNNTITKEYLKSQDAKFGVVHAEDINYYGMPEEVIEDYIHDAFKSAKENDERVFLTHLTSTTHHPFGLPKSEKYVPVASGKGKIEDLSKYLNAVGYVDRWLEKILDILVEEGVADETLLVFVGDHGLSIPENNGITPYYNPNVGNFEVPLVLSHPKLPPIDINDAVVSSQILPTILDLLVETGSLHKSHIKPAKDLTHNYEGQSLLRPLINFSDKTGQANWQFTVMNPGRSTIGVRDARQPHFRLTVPIVDNTEWRFTDLTSDPHEQKATVAFGHHPFLRKVESEHGIDASKWAEEASFISRWWVEENSQRWRYDPSK